MENKLMKFVFREIKFRVWHIKLEKMEYPYVPLKEDSGFWDGISATRCGLVNSQIKDNESLIWLLYTGLKDINGREIYEGDLFPADHLGNLYRVAWNNEAAKFSVVIERTSGKTIGIPKIAMQDLCKREICGNICQNPISTGL